MRVSQAQKVVLFRSLATLLNSGVPLIDAFASVEAQSRDPHLISILQTVQGRLATGYTLSRALSAHGEVFSDIVVALVRVAERSGKMHLILEKIADFTESKDRIQRRLGAALIYPAFVLLLCLALLILAPVFVFSDLLDLLRGLGTPLPIATRLYLGLSSALLSFWTYLLLVPLAIGAVWLVQRVLQDSQRRMVLERLFLGVRGLGSLLRNSEQAMVSATLATCYESGIPVLDSLKLSERATRFLCLRMELGESREALKQGEGLAESLRRCSIMDAQSLGLIAGGEEVGLVAESLSTIAQESERKSEYAIETFQKLLEPCLLLFVGGLVSFIAIAVLGPTLSMVENL